MKINNKKLIYNDTPQTWEFYDLKLDPTEQHNIYSSSLDEVNLMKTKLINFLKENNISTKIS